MSRSGKTAKITVSVVIVSFNTREITLKCLQSLDREFALSRSLEAEIWVVDNASHDGSVEAIRSTFPDVHVLANADNAGFGAANNQAMRQAGGEFFLLINSDAFVHSGAIATLIAEASSDPQIAVVGPRLLNADGSLQPSCWRFPSPGRVWLENLGLSSLFAHDSRFGDYSGWTHDERREVDFVSGACFLIRREVWERSGGFDEAFKLYAEETDWQKRLRRDGWKIVFVPQAQVTHLGGASGAGKPSTRHFFFEGLDRYTRKHHGLAGVLGMRWGMIIGSFFRAILYTFLAFVPTHSAVARQKSRLHWWLLWRQSTHWRLP